MFKNKMVLTALSCCVLAFTSCKKDDDTKTEPETTTDGTYSFLVGAGSPSALYLIQANSLTEGTISTTGNGVEIDYGMITSRDGYYYGYDYSSSNLVKFTTDNKTKTIVKEIPFTQISWAGYSSFYAWKDASTLVLFSSNGSQQFEYAILDVTSMSITKSGNINIPAAAGDDYYWGNNVTFVGNKLYISYAKFIGANDELPDGNTYLASMDYPDMTNVTITTDKRSYYTSPYNLNCPGAIAYNGSAYFLNSNTVWSASATNSPTAILRVNNGGTTFDDSYFYELVDNTKEEVMGLFSLGNGKAIVKVYTKSLLSTTASYGTAKATTFYVVDLAARSKTAIDIPASITGAYTNNVFVENGVAYIVANAGDGYYVYAYNIASGAVTKGLKLEGINGLDKIERIK